MYKSWSFQTGIWASACAFLVKKIKVWQTKSFLTSQTGGYGSVSCSEREESAVTGSQVYGCKDGGGRWASQKPRTLELLCHINTKIRKLWFQHPVWWTGSHHLQHSPGYTPFFFFFFHLKGLPSSFWPNYIQMSHWSGDVVSLSLLSKLPKTVAASYLDNSTLDANCIKNFDWVVSI